MPLPKRGTMKQRIAGPIRNSVAAESRKVASTGAVAGVTRYDPNVHSTDIIESRPARNPQEKHATARRDIVQIGGKVVATNDPGKFIERRRKPRLDLKV